MTTIGPLEDCSVEELSSALRVGLEAPLLLTAAFLRATARWRGERRVLNISSGLGRRAMAGQATYCAAKAGMDNLSRAVALDQALLANGAKIVSLAPGVIDTDMQMQLRSSSGAGFPERQTFVKLKESGQLTSSRDAAARLVAYLGRRRFRRQPGGRRSRSLTSRRARRPLRLRHNSAHPATNSARSTRPETLHVTTRARRPRLGRASLRLRADAAGARRHRTPPPRRAARGRIRPTG